MATRDKLLNSVMKSQESCSRVCVGMASSLLLAAAPPEQLQGACGCYRLRFHLCIYLLTNATSPLPKESVTGLLWSMANFSHRPCQSSAYLKTPTSPGAEEGYQPLMQPATPTVAINNSSSSHSLLAYTLLPSHFASSSSSMECLQG